MNTQEILDWMCKELRPFFTTMPPRGLGWTKQDCIRTAKMAVKFLKRKKIHAKELSTITLIANQPLAKWMKEHDTNLAEITPQQVKHVPGAYLLYMGRRDAKPVPNMWRGHLPVIVENQWLLDLTIDAGHDPEIYLHLQPLNVKIQRHDIPFFIENDQQILYVPDPINDKYKTTTAWKVWSDYHEMILDAAEYALDHNTKIVV